ncbi:hypothetical protein GOQ27_13160 [Clostridium sp. D2Q-11]|uniref:Uncharacterized protein n=1 Tax=Anaeromonas frigoriresistens TaxID=2683708 RepID=A0A942UZ11_9FIRM|nr:hypothetical protein [Anaeromonas frigoriresistens]MBS4539419.1 hypothetical protein [Anaeromonas frigoriresistens]
MKKCRYPAKYTVDIVKFPLVILLDPMNYTRSNFGTSRMMYMRSNWIKGNCLIYI